MIAFTLTKFSYKVFPQESSVIINTSTLFYPCNSWLNRINVKKSIVHEQLHFDIAEYQKRLFLKRVSESTLTEKQNVCIIKTICRDVAEQKKSIDIEYDEGTGNRQNQH